MSYKEGPIRSQNNPQKPRIERLRGDRFFLEGLVCDLGFEEKQARIEQMDFSDYLRYRPLLSAFSLMLNYRFNSHQAYEIHPKVEAYLKDAEIPTGKVQSRTGSIRFIAKVDQERALDALAQVGLKPRQRGKAIISLNSSGILDPIF